MGPETNHHCFPALVSFAGWPTRVGSISGLLTTPFFTGMMVTDLITAALVDISITPFLPSSPYLSVENGGFNTFTDEILAGLICPCSVLTPSTYMTGLAPLFLFVSGERDRLLPSIIKLPVLSGLALLSEMFSTVTWAVPFDNCPLVLPPATDPVVDEERVPEKLPP